VSDVFVSRPAWIEPAFVPGLEAFLDRLRDAGLSPHTLGSSDYPLTAPMDEVITLLDGCRGAIILGYPQVFVTQGRVRSETLVEPLTLGTEWNHIEAALAYSRRLPLLVIHHTGVSRGIFDRGVLGGFIYELDLAQPGWCHEPTVSGVLATWKTRVAAATPAAPAALPAATAPSGSKPCPNCSTADRPFYLCKLERGFMNGATHICTKCHSIFNYA